MGVLPLPLPDARDEELLKIICEANAHQDRWKTMQKFGHTNGWEVFLPYKETIYQCKTADDFWQIVQQATKSWTRTFSDNKWPDIENYISKLISTTGLINSGDSNTKQFMLRASKCKFIIRHDIPVSGPDYINIQYLGDKDTIEISMKDFNNEAVEIK